MAEYIAKEAAIKAAEHAYHEWNLAMAAADGKREINLVYKRQELCKAVEAVFDIVPAADVAPVVHGRWEWLGPNRLVADCMCGTCSACKVRSKYIVNPMLCPNCGARMDGGASE